jgi:hypothetical protein
VHKFPPFFDFSASIWEQVFSRNSIISQIFNPDKSRQSIPIIPLFPTVLLSFNHLIAILVHTDSMGRGKRFSLLSYFTGKESNPAFLRSAVVLRWSCPAGTVTAQYSALLTSLRVMAAVKPAFRKASDWARALASSLNRPVCRTTTETAAEGAAEAAAGGAEVTAAGAGAEVAGVAGFAGEETVGAEAAGVGTVGATGVAITGFAVSTGGEAAVPGKSSHNGLCTTLMAGEFF